jgi:GNAT superfamily N-acetyltransferase
MPMKIETFEQDAARQYEPLVALATEVFEGLRANYIEERLPHVLDPLLVVASDRQGWAGFKLGYRRGSTFYSWLGGVHPRARRQGLGYRLMAAQHEHVRQLGYTRIATRMRAANRAMLILNLKCGYEITGFEVDRAGFSVVSQQKVLE